MKTYDPKDVSVVIAGTFITGFAEGTFVEAVKDEVNYTPHVGAQGEVSRTKNADSMGTITITLKSTSPSNAFLNRLAKSINTFPSQVIDANSGKAKAGGNESWVEKPAGLEFGGEESDREWVIKVADYDQDIRN